MFNNWPGQYRYISGGSSKSSSKPALVNTFSPSQEYVLEALFNQVLPGTKGQVPSYPGAMSVPKTPEEQTYFGAVPGLAGELAAYRQKIGQPAYEINPETTEQFYQQSIRAPAMQEWREVTEPAIREAAVGPGYWGSERARNTALGAEHLATTLGQQRAQLYYADEQARREAAEAGAGRFATGAPGAIGQETEMLGTAGQYARQIEQEKVMGELQRWLMGETVEGVTPTMYNPFLQLAFQFLGLDQYAVGQKEKSSSWNFGIG